MGDSIIGCVSGVELGVFCVDFLCRFSGSKFLRILLNFESDNSVNRPSNRFARLFITGDKILFIHNKNKQAHVQTDMSLRLSTEILIGVLAVSVVIRFILTLLKHGSTRTITHFGPKTSQAILNFTSIDHAPIELKPVHYLPKVPFYMYSDKRLTWLDNCLLNPRNQIEKHKKFKHGDDVWFLEQAANHPWRVENPEDAKIFIVPALMSYVMRYQHCTQSKEALPTEPIEAVPVAALHPGHADWVRRWGVMQTAVSIGLKNSTWFKRNNGNDHIIVSSDFHIRYPNVLGNRMQTVMGNMMYGYFEDLPNIDYDHAPNVYEFSRVESPKFWRCTVVVPYAKVKKLTTINV